jgi:hypothetical protein
MSFILPVTSHLYSTLSSPRQSKQTMTKLMDDQTNGWMMMRQMDEMMLHDVLYFARRATSIFYSFSALS